MSRPIKFRIWDGHKKEWLGASDKKSLTYYGFSLVGEVMNVQSPPFWALGEGMTVEEYTGLKDENGKEIYEGDIVKEYSDGVSRIGKVEWDNRNAGFRVAWNNSIYVARDNNSVDEVEGTVTVIGNIHENPELLKEEE